MSEGDLVLYRTADGKSEFYLKELGGMVWLSQKDMADLYEAIKQNISLHIKNIFEGQEWDESSVVKEYLATATDGKSYNTKHYNLPMILAAVMRVRSQRSHKQMTAHVHDLCETFDTNHREQADQEADRQYIEDLKAIEVKALSAKKEGE